MKDLENTKLPDSEIRATDDKLLSDQIISVDQKENTDSIAQLSEISAMSATTDTDPVITDPKSYPEAPYICKVADNESVSLGSGSLQYTVTDFVLPGKNGFDLNITRQYDSDNSNTTDMDAFVDLGPPSFVTISRANDHNLKQYGLGFGWSFKFPSIEVVPEAKRDGHVKYNTHLHLDDGKSYMIEDNKLKDYKMKDVWLETVEGTITHPKRPELSKSYNMTVCYQNGNKDYFSKANDYNGKLDCWRLAARCDRFGNAIFFSFPDVGGIEIVDTWGRDIILEKVNKAQVWRLPDGSTIQYQTEDTNGRKLVAVVDQLFRTTLYEYEQLIALGRIFAPPDPGTDIRYMLLKKIIQPSGAVTEYQYGVNGQEPIRLAQGSGSKRYYPVKIRKDIADGMEYNVISYYYTLSDDDKYIREARSENLNSVEEKQIFNDKGQLITKEIREAGVLVSSSEYTYGTDKDAADYKLQKSESTKEYNKTNSEIFVRKNTDTTYTADKKTNVERKVESYPDDPTLDQDTFMTYGAYGTMTEKVINKNEEVKIREVYSLRSDPDDMVVEFKRVYENDELKEKTRYVYGTGEDDKNLVVRELRYFAGENEDFEASESFVETQKAYDSGQFTSEPVVTRVVGMVDAGGQAIEPIVQHVIYDCMGRAVCKIDADGFETETEYDALGRVVCERHPEIDGKRAEKRNVYDDTFNTVTVIDENGNRKRMEYTQMGKIKAEYVAMYDRPFRDDVLLKSFGYDALGRTISETTYDGEGSAAENVRAVTECRYDTKDRVISTRVAAAGYEATEEYADVYPDPERAGKKWLKHTKTVHGGGVTPDIVTAEYMDQKGQKRFEFAAGRRVMTTEYDYVGNAVLTIDALNNKTYTAYDHAARTVLTLQYVGDMEHITRTIYDALGNNTRTIDPAGCVTEYTYDAIGRKLRQSSDFDERRAVEEYEYDGRGNVTEQRTKTDSGWRETSNEYDARAQLTAAVMWLDADKTEYSRTEYIYDSVGNKTEVRTGLSESNNEPAIHRYKYDNFGNVTVETDALGQITRSEFDKTGRLDTKTDRNGSRMEYTYDALENITEQRVIAKAGFGEILSVRETVYVPAGQKRSETARETVNGKETALTISYVYDEFGRVIEQREPEETVKHFTYDAGGNRISFRFYRNSSVEPVINLWYSYDELNKLIAVRRGGAEGEIYAEYEYDLKGNPTIQRFPNAGIETTYGYNFAGLTTWLKNIKSGKVVSEFYYTNGIDGNQLTKKNNELENHYEYDKLGRLTAEREVEGNTYLYEYDAFSNRSKLTVSGIDKYVTDYEYDLNNRLLTETHTERDFTEVCRYSYDGNGNQIRARREVIEGKKPWSGPERHLFVTAPKRNGKATLDLRDYNGFGQLVQIYRDGQRINFSYRPDNMRHSKEVTYPFKPALNRKTKYFWNGQNIVLETNTSGEIKAIYLRGFQLIAQQIGEENFYYLHNAHGDVVQRIAENGTSAPQYKYDAFGNEKEPNNTDPNPFRYCGEYFDFETGEIYLRARSYDPATSRFLSEDPAKDGENWYAYCGNNPIKNVDPSGRMAISQLVKNTKDTTKDDIFNLNDKKFSRSFSEIRLEPFDPSKEELDKNERKGLVKKKREYEKEKERRESKKRKQEYEKEKERLERERLRKQRPIPVIPSDGEDWKVTVDWIVAYLGLGFTIVDILAFLGIISTIPLIGQIIIFIVIIIFAIWGFGRLAGVW